MQVIVGEFDRKFSQSVKLMRNKATTQKVTKLNSCLNHTTGQRKKISPENLNHKGYFHRFATPNSHHHDGPRVSETYRG
jgi:hypothetical protein